MTSNEITDAIMAVARGNCSVNEGVKALNMSVIDFERLMNSWEDAQIAWNKMIQVAIISELKHEKTDDEIMKNLGCSKAEVKRNKRLLGRTLEVLEEVRAGKKTPGCGSCIARMYISEFAKMMEQEKNNGES